jgi:hypothetical protein
MSETGEAQARSARRRAIAAADTVSSHLPQRHEEAA